MRAREGPRSAGLLHAWGRENNLGFQGTRLAHRLWRGLLTCVRKDHVGWGLVQSFCMSIITSAVVSGESDPLWGHAYGTAATRGEGRWWWWWWWLPVVLARVFAGVFAIAGSR